MRTSYRTLRFGVIEYLPAEVVQMDRGFPPFTGATRYVLIQRPDEDPFAWLQSLDDSALAIVVAPLDLLYPDHAETVRADLSARRGEEFAQRASLLGVVVLNADPSQMTINLVAAIVLDFETMQAEQIVVDAPVEMTRHRVAPAVKGTAAV